MQDQPNDQITFLYKFSEQYNPIYVNGAFGGPNPKGEIVMNFFMERHPIPKEMTQEIVDGKLGQTTKIVPENHNRNFVRFIETGTIMSLETAKSIHEWLGNHIANLEKTNKNNG